MTEYLLVTLAVLTAATLIQHLGLGRSRSPGVEQGGIMPSVPYVLECACRTCVYALSCRRGCAVVHSCSLLFQLAFALAACAAKIIHKTIRL
jgi:hypothetical protein